MKGCPSGCRHDPGTACRGHRMPGQGYQPLGKWSRRTRCADRQENSAGIGVQHGRACLTTHEKELELQKNPAAALFGLPRGRIFSCFAVNGKSASRVHIGALVRLCRRLAVDIFQFHPHPYGMHLKLKGLSHLS